MQGQVLVSVIVSNFNYAAYVGRAIESVLAQTYAPVELIVVDDGSTDGSRGEILRYDDRATVIFKENGGQASTYNSGFLASHGEIVLFLDADDALRPDALESVVAAWSPGTAKVQFYLDCVDADERLLGRRKPNVPFADKHVLGWLSSYGYYPSPPSSGNAYARDVLEKLLPMPTKTWRIGADGYLIALAALYGQVVSIDRALAIYRIHGRNNYLAGAVDLPRLRRLLSNEIDREIAFRKHADMRSFRIGRSLVLSIPSHCKARLLSLKLDPAGHPYPQDRLLSLVWAGIRSSATFPHNSWPKRLLAPLAFPLLAIAPRGWLAARLPVLFLSQTRIHALIPLRRRPSLIQSD